MKLSDYIVDFFEKMNSDTVFMLTGGGCMHLVDSFGKSEKIQYVCTHHEQAAAMAAEAYAKYCNKIPIVVVTSGPGATNAITGLLGAYQDSVPCIFLSGQAKRKQTVYNAHIESLRQFGVQEVNIIPIVSSITKYSVMINNADEIKYHLQKAIYFAMTGRPGPVWIDVPLDIQSSLIDETMLKSFDPNIEIPSIKTKASQSEIEFVAAAINKAIRPVIIAGHGIRLANACNELQELAEKTKIPVVTPIMGIDVLASNNTVNIGRIGTKGTRAGNFAMQNADLIISIGSRLSVSVVGHEYELFAPNAKKIVIDIDENEHKKKTIKIDKLIISDAKYFLSKLLVLCEKKHNSEWLQVCNTWKEKYPVCISEYNNSEAGLNFYKFVDILTNKTDSQTTIISDAGSAFYVVSQAANIKEGQRYITSGAIATMGFGLPAAIGVAAANKKGKVATITGDGSFQQNIQELAVVKYHNYPIKIFLMNNNGYLSIRQTQNRYFNGNLVGESSQSGIMFPDYKKIAEAYGLNYHYIDSIESAEKELDNILNSEIPILCEVKICDNQEIIPTNSARIMEDGTMQSTSLEDMYPFLPREEYEEIMDIKNKLC